MAKAGEEQNTQQPTGGKGAGFHTKRQNITKDELPKQKGARAIFVLEKVKNMYETGPSVASKKGKRGCPSSGLMEQDSGKRHNEGCQRYRKKKKGESLRLQNIEEAAMTEHVNQDAMPIDDFIEVDDLISFSTEKMPTDDFIELDDLTSFNIEKMPMPMDDYIEMDDFTTFVTDMFGSFFDGQYSPALGRKEAAMNEPPVQYEEIG